MHRKRPKSIPVVVSGEGLQFVGFIFIFPHFCCSESFLFFKAAKTFKCILLLLIGLPTVCRLTLTVLVVTIDAQWEGMGDVGSARYEPALLPSCPTIRVLSSSN